VKEPMRVKMPMWAGYRAGKDAPSTGDIEVAFHGPKNARKLAEVRATVRRAGKLKPAILAALLAGYPSYRRWGRRPKTTTVAKLEGQIALWQVLMTADHYEGVSYVIWSFSTAWDPSGLDVLTHKDRVIAAGDTNSELLVYPLPDPVRGEKTAKPITPAARKKVIAIATKRARKNAKTLSAELEIVLPAWAGFAAKAGAKPSHGEAMIEVDRIGPAQHAAYAAVLADPASTQKRVLAAIAKKYSKASPFDDLLDLAVIHIHPAARDGIASVGYELACRWDREHGVGVMTHAGEVVAVGEADLAFDPHIAQRCK
jgi:hypothetical protein